MRLVFGCGGTGGHIFPALAIAERLQEDGHDLLFIGNADGMEASLVAAEGYAFSAINVRKLNRKLTPQLLVFPYFFLKSIITCVSVISKYRASAVFCTGGYVSGPVAAAAVLTRTPLYFHESNSLPGITTKAFARFAKITFISFAASRDHLHNARLIEVGIPLMKRVLTPLDTDTDDLGLDPDKPVIIVSGGSQGSAAINNAVDEALQDILAMGFSVIWQAGKASYPALREKYSDQPDLYLFDFSPRLALFYRRASIAITRAGAMTLAELEENRLPSILVPLPTAAENHQYYNAVEQQRKGFGMVLEQKVLGKETLLKAISDLYKNRDNYVNALSNLPGNTAAADIVSHIMGSLEKGK